MTYEVKISETLRSAPPSNIVIPISMGDGALSGERLKALIEELQGLGHKLTVVIADSLNRHNSKNLTSDLANGQNYLEENEGTLSRVTVQRWDDWVKGDREAEFKEKLALVEERSKPKSEIYNKLLRTCKKALLRTPTEDSLTYLREEYAVFLMFHDFDYLVYTKPITDGLASIDKNFRDEKKPCYEFVRVNAVDASNVAELGMFKQKKSKVVLPLAGNMAFDATEAFLKSPQISLEHKRIFLDMMVNLISITLPPEELEELTVSKINTGKGAKQ